MDRKRDEGSIVAHRVVSEFQSAGVYESRDDIPCQASS